MDFCGSSEGGVLFSAARAFLSVLASQPTRKTRMLSSEWEELFRIGHNDKSQQRVISQRRAELSELFCTTISQPDQEYRALFALHTAYALVVKLVAYRMVCDVHFGGPRTEYAKYVDADALALQSFCAGLEDGEVFRELGILNLLEGDFFSWYADRDQWNQDIAGSVRGVLSTLGGYEGATGVFGSERAMDLFRGLYEATVPRTVRSSFGEFYTPPWLAEHVIRSAGFDGSQRVLDPCAGSGTFLVCCIRKLRERLGGAASDTLNEVLSRVVGIDLNPLAVLTSRVNYFLHIADLLPANDCDIIIPVYLGDATHIADRIVLGGVECLTYKLSTLDRSVDVIIPECLITAKTQSFASLMLQYERAIKDQDEAGATDLLTEALPPFARTEPVHTAIAGLSANLLELERKGWNGIWARILTNFLTTACLGRFEVIVGNPPWIDWKNLPETYRRRIKSLCIDRGLFSGDGRTGGINLNVCALIANVAADAWLAPSGRMAFLMPEELALQQSYQGWRKLSGKWGFERFHDWTAAGHPFGAVKEDFFTYVISRDAVGRSVVPVTRYVQAVGHRGKASEWQTIEDAEANLQQQERVAAQLQPGSTIFTFADTRTRLREYGLVAGDCAYLGREGIEFYPQELLVFTDAGPGPESGTRWLENIQVPKAKYHVQHGKVLLETEFLFPLVRGPALATFGHEYGGLIVAFPYDPVDPRRPLAMRELRNRSRLLARFFRKSQALMEAQTDFSDKIRGPDAGPYYGLARVGPYSFHGVHVAYRDNTKWCACVVTSCEMPWGETKRFLFQNHAVSISERKDGRPIGIDEAHFVCAALNAPVVAEYICASSDSRSFKIRPPVYVPLFDQGDHRHQEMSTLSRRAHADRNRIPEIEGRINQLYIELCREGCRGA